MAAKGSVPHGSAWHRNVVWMARNACDNPSPAVAERRLVRRYGRVTARDVLDLHSFIGWHYANYTGFITVTGKLTGNIDDQHVEVIGRHVFHLPEDADFAWDRVHRAGLIRVTAAVGLGVQPYGPPNEAQLRTLRQLAARARREGVEFYWDAPPAPASRDRSVLRRTVGGNDIASLEGHFAHQCPVGSSVAVRALPRPRHR